MRCPACRDEFGTPQGIVLPRAPSTGDLGVCGSCCGVHQYVRGRFGLEVRAWPRGKPLPPEWAPAILEAVRRAEGDRVLTEDMRKARGPKERGWILRNLN